jgi:vacuolar-type H+-ATPase subunit F/Vma7
MATKIVGICLPDLALLLGLTGVVVRTVQGPAEAEKELSGLMDEGADIVLVDETFRGKFSEWFSNRLARHTGKPLIIYCPRFAEADADTDAYINAILKPAVGFEIRLN